MRSFFRETGHGFLTQYHRKNLQEIIGTSIRVSVRNSVMREIRLWFFGYLSSASVAFCAVCSETSLQGIVRNRQNTGAFRYCRECHTPAAERF